MDGIIRRPSVQKNTSRQNPLSKSASFSCSSQTSSVREDDRDAQFKTKEYPRLQSLPKEELFVRRYEAIEDIERTFRKRRNLFRFLIAISGIVLFFSVSWFFYFTWKVHAISQKMSFENTSKSFASNLGSAAAGLIPTMRTPLKGESEGRINILLLGMAGKDKPGNYLTDTIMVASIDTEQKRISLLSLPRDLYAPIPKTKLSSKINAIYNYGLRNDLGIEPIKNTVEEIIALPVHYYVIVDFDGFEQIINDIGGITVTSERDILDTRYPGPNYSYETFSLPKGTHQLDGATALKYARVRHGDPEGDFGRAKRQQQIMQAAKNKAFSARTLLNAFALSNLLDTLGENIKTNIAFEEIESFILLGKELDTQNITNVVVDAWKKDSLLKVSHLYFENTRAFILIPRTGDFHEIQELAKTIFDREALLRRKESIKKENPSILLVNASETSILGKDAKEILEDFFLPEGIAIASANTVQSIQNQTLVIDNTQTTKPFSLDVLVKKMSAQVESSPWEISEFYDYDFIVIMGNDLAKKISFEKDSIEQYNDAKEEQVYLNVMNEAAKAEAR